MKGKKVIQLNWGGTNIKDPDIFQWKIQDVGYSKPMSYKIDELEDGGIYYRVDAAGTVMSNEQFVYLNGTLVSMANDAHIAKDFKCQADNARKEGWYFAKFASSMPDQTQLENDAIIEVLKSSGIIDSHIAQMKKLNDTGDRENITMVNKLLKTKYEVDIQREGIQG
jgi:hypothetical protein